VNPPRGRVGFFQPEYRGNWGGENEGQKEKKAIGCLKKKGKKRHWENSKRSSKGAIKRDQTVPVTSKKENPLTTKVERDRLRRKADRWNEKGTRAEMKWLCPKVGFVKVGGRGKTARKKKGRLTEKKGGENSNYWQKTKTQHCFIKKKGKQGARRKQRSQLL